MRNKEMVMKFAKNTLYKFEVKKDADYVVAFSVKARDPWSAMVSANKNCGPLPQGAWMESSKDTFYWAEGNFFD